MADEQQTPRSDELADALDLSQEELARIKDMHDEDYDEFLDLVEEGASGSHEMSDEAMADVSGGLTVMDLAPLKKNPGQQWSMSRKQLQNLVFNTMGHHGTLDSVLAKCGCDAERNYARQYWAEIDSDARMYLGRTGDVCRKWYTGPLG